jgi:hypothetical protein
LLCQPGQINVKSWHSSQSSTALSFASFHSSLQINSPFCSVICSQDLEKLRRLSLSQGPEQF